MKDRQNVSLKVKNYKCFGQQEQGFEKILPVNLIIGKNNSGKSALLDAIGHVTEPKILAKQLWHKEAAPQIIFTDTLGENELKRVFPENTSGGSIPGSHWKYGSKWIGKKITWALKVVISQDKRTDRPVYKFVKTEPPFEIRDKDKYQQNLVNAKANPYLGLKFKRLFADRDISPEPDAGELKIESNGRGLTNVIQNYLNNAELPSELIEDTLLTGLNTIFGADGNFERILVQKQGGHWELYLEEQNKGWVSLSNTGSGLKTVLLVLAFIHLVPRIEQEPIEKYLFGFEELENNLHPSLQRRLLAYLRDIAENKGCKFFITTHSNVAIDFFSGDSDAQILHVTHDGSNALVKPVETYIDNKGVLDDLDVRASDLLQANGIVWVEGPSDRLYFNRWIELLTDGKVKEGAHYQCMFYGGKLLAHLDAAAPDTETEKAVKILRINRNAIIMIDSDRSKQGQRINKTKQRIISEITDIGGLSWLTSGREVENYIPSQALGSLLGLKNSKPLEQFADISKYFPKIKKGKKNIEKKMLLAEEVCPHITKEGISQTLDLEKQAKKTIRKIKKWNGI